MKVSVLKQEGLTRELEVTVPAETILKHVETQLVSYGKTAKIAGFRVFVLRDGRPSGQITSAAWGQTVGSSVGLAYVHDPESATTGWDYVESGRWQADVGGTLVPIELRRSLG